MRCHIQKTIANCFAVHANCAVSDGQFQRQYHTLVVAVVFSQLDYGNAVLVGLPAYLYNRLQSVLNAAARSIAGLQCSDHITDTLASFHWLKLPDYPESIQFKLASIVH